MTPDMPTRTITVNGRSWRVFPSGFTTANHLDEFGLIFVAGEGDAREVRVTRYSPLTTRSREQSLLELTDDDLAGLLRLSQASDTSPEGGYRASALPGLS
jgi:hypothetical protein